MRPELDLILWRGGVGKASVRFGDAAQVARMRERIDRFSLFDPAEYLERHADLEGQDGGAHFAEYGVWEPHRAFAGAKSVARWLGEVSQGTLPTPPQTDAGRLTAVLDRTAGLHIGVHVHSQARWVAGAVADGLVAALGGLGLAADRLDERADPREHRHRIFVSPGEFFTLPGGAGWATPERLARSLVLVVDPPSEPEFRASIPFALLAGGVIDLHPHGVALWRGAGVPALAHLPLSLEDGIAAPEHPLVRGLPRAARAWDPSADLWADRPLDLAFFGTESDVRDEFFAVNAARFAGRPTVVSLTRRLGPSLAVHADEVRAALEAYVGRRAKVVLNLARDEIGLVDPRRMILGGFAQKALVVSTPLLPHPVFRPGVHYLEESWRRIPKLIDWLIETPDGRLTAERVRLEGHAALMEHAAPMSAAAAAAEFLAEHAR